MRRITGWMGVTGLALVFGACRLSGQMADPSAVEDAKMERQAILQAADRMELLVHQNEQLQLDLGKLREQVAALEAEQAKLRERLQGVEQAREKDRQALLNEVSRLVAGGAPAPRGEGVAPAAGGNLKGYEHVVEPGQSLWAIAKAFNDQGVKVSVEEIKRANGLGGDSLRPGQKLFIPENK